MNYADIKYCDVANGKGVRVSLFVSGCTHHCKGCFNEEAWDFQYGKPFTEETIRQVMVYLDRPYIAGLSLLGGEPFEHVNQQGLLPLLRQVKAKFPEKNIWCYTGYDFEKDILGRMAGEWKETEEMLSYIDILVDGEFVEAEKNPGLQFRGSSNQRIIEVQASLAEGRIVLWEPEEYVHVVVKEN
ncbi:MAG: anaerobic ribonucleoside-triphosphate reductase activating protein [Coprococcus sp.]